MPVTRNPTETRPRVACEVRPERDAVDPEAVKGLRILVPGCGSGIGRTVARPCRRRRVRRDRSLRHVRAVQEHIRQNADLRILRFYDAADRARGHVTCRDYRSGEEIRVSLVTVHAEPPRIYNQD